MAVCRGGFESPLHRCNQGVVLRRAGEAKRGGKDAPPEREGVLGGTHVGEGGHGQGFVGRDHDGGLCLVAKSALGGLHDRVA